MVEVHGIVVPAPLGGGGRHVESEFAQSLADELALSNMQPFHHAARVGVFEQEFPGSHYGEVVVASVPLSLIKFSCHSGVIVR